MENGFELNAFDSASIDLIKQSVRRDLHFKHPYVLSPYYNKTPVILYHLAKLMSDDKKGIFTEIKEELIQDIYRELATTKIEMYRLILYTSLYQLGENPEPEIDFAALLNGADDFYWFSSNFMVAVGTGVTLRKVLNDAKIVPTFYWKCEPFYWTLLLEFLVLSEPETDEGYTLISPTK